MRGKIYGQTIRACGWKMYFMVKIPYTNWICSGN